MSFKKLDLMKFHKFMQMLLIHVWLSSILELKFRTCKPFELQI
jgi:hypothetical protein